MKKCKMCENELNEINQNIYCSNICKFSDSELNLKRVRKEKNDSSKLIKCNLCDYVTKDILNLGGYAVKHLNLMHNGLKFDNYMEYYNVIDTPFINKWECPICHWKSKDIKNVSGWITNHVLSHTNIEDFINIYPEYKILFKKQNEIIKKNKELLINDNNIVCKICGQMFYKLSQTHLNKHGITPKEYKLKFGINNTSSKKTVSLQSEKSNAPETKKKMIQSLLLTNNSKFGKNSYTQTECGKKIIRKRTLDNTYEKYINSELLSEHVKLMFSKEEYDGNSGKSYNFLCKKCNNIFLGKIENGRIPRCFVCYPKINTGVSKSEIEINNFIVNELGILTEKLKICNLEIDIFSSLYNIGIEYDGLYWHSELSGGKDSHYHLNKTNLCINAGIKLIHIFEDEWLYKKDVVKSKLRNIFKKTKNIIYARKCIIKEISYIEKNDFLDKYHLQSHDNMAVKSIGLYFDNELVSVMTFTKYRYSKQSGVYELSRFSNKNDVIVVGAFTKLLKFFIKNIHPKKIITYADKRWSTIDNVYVKNGFAFGGHTSVSYWYINNSHNRLHRFNYRKSKLSKKLKYYDENLSEWENMQLNDYDRIWDCGSLKYEMILTN